MTQIFNSRREMSFSDNKILVTNIRVTLLFIICLFHLFRKCILNTLLGAWNREMNEALTAPDLEKHTFMGKSLNKYLNS